MRSPPTSESPQIHPVQESPLNPLENTEGPAPPTSMDVDGATPDEPAISQSGPLPITATPPPDQPMDVDEILPRPVDKPSRPSSSNSGEARGLCFERDRTADERQISVQEEQEVEGQITARLEEDAQRSPSLPGDDGRPLTPFTDEPGDAADKPSPKGDVTDADALGDEDEEYFGSKGDVVSRNMLQLYKTDAHN